MAKKHINVKTKIAAVEALKSGQSYKDVMKRYKITASSLLYKWRKQYDAGQFGNANVAPMKTDANLSREQDHHERVRQAIGLLRQAEADVDRRKLQGKLKEADNAHLYAGLALRLLQGDNGK